MAVKCEIIDQSLGEDHSCHIEVEPRQFTIFGGGIISFCNDGKDIMIQCSDPQVPFNALYVRGDSNSFEQLKRYIGKECSWFYQRTGEVVISSIIE